MFGVHFRSGAAIGDTSLLGNVVHEAGEMPNEMNMNGIRPYALLPLSAVATPRRRRGLPNRLIVDAKTMLSAQELKANQYFSKTQRCHFLFDDAIKLPQLFVHHDQASFHLPLTIRLRPNQTKFRTIARPQHWPIGECLFAPAKLHVVRKEKTDFDSFVRIICELAEGATYNESSGDLSVPLCDLDISGGTRASPVGLLNDATGSLPVLDGSRIDMDEPMPSLATDLMVFPPSIGQGMGAIPLSLIPGSDEPAVDKQTTTGSARVFYQNRAETQ